MCKSRELSSSVYSGESVGVGLCVSEWYCSLLLSVMYAGLFTLNEGHFFYCEGPPCTAPLSFWSVFGLLVIILSPMSSPIRFRNDLPMSNLQKNHLKNDVINEPKYRFDPN